MVDETTTEQLAEIEGQAENTPATGYTPPEGWRVLAVGERLQPSDVWVNHEGESRPTKRAGERVNDERYIRPIEPQPQPQPQPQSEAEPVQVREGRWRTRGGDIRNVTATPEGDGRKYTFPWWDAQYRQTWTSDGRYYLNTADQRDLIEYLGPIEQQPQTEPQPQPEPEPQPEPDTELQAQVAFLKGREVTLGTRLQQEREVTTRLRGELESVQNLLGTERRRVTELEELVTSLRTINRGCENAVRDAGKENTALRNQLAAVKAELASVAADRQQLRVELDAAQQVPADSPELRQLRADLEQMTQERDQYLDSYQRIFGDLETIRETTKAVAVEAIVEWLVPIRTCGSQALATAVISNLPHIMRSLTGLSDEEIE